jgi:transposase
MSRPRMLEDWQWDKIKPYLPVKLASRKGGRPRVGDRECLEGILWVLKTGARW